MLRLKSDADIDGIREASQILSAVLNTVKKHCQKGVTPLELDGIAQAEIQNAGVQASFLGYQGFPNALCTSLNEEVIHGIPTDRQLKDGDIIGIDCGIQMGKYFTDAAFTVGIGSITPLHQRLLTATETALYKGIQAGSEGKYIPDISRAIYEHIVAEKFGTVQMFSGHGVGFAVHEEPSVPNYITSYPRIRLREGLVIAIEPMVCVGSGDVYIKDDQWTVVTADGNYAAHFEHTVAYYDGMFHILTKSV